MSNDTRVSEVTSSQQEPERERRIMTFKATQLIWLLLGILEAAIALRIGLKLIGANPGSPIVVLIYGLLGWAAERVVWLAFYRPRGPIVGTTQTTTSEHRSTP